MNHYDELGVPPTAPAVEIRRAYLALARRFHPDRLHASSAAERAAAAARMSRINAAWTVLSDPAKRAAYDANLRGDAPTATGYVRDVGDTWRPFDDGGEDIDPRLLDDTPTGAPTLRRGLTFVPAGLAVAGIGASILGMLIGLGGLLGIGIVLIIGSGLSFLLLPLVALINSSRADRDP